MQNIPPWLIMQKNQPEDELMASLTSGIGIPGLGQMAHDADPVNNPRVTKPPRDQQLTERPIVKVPPPPSKQVSQMRPSSMSASVSTKSVDPNLSALAEKLRGQLSGLRNDRLGIEESGLQDYQEMLDKYQGASPGIDWTPLAGLLDQWAGGNSATQAAIATKPESAQERRKNIEAMKSNLQAMKGQISDRQYKALQAELDSVTDEMKQNAASAKLQESMDKFNTAEERRRQQYDSGELIKFQKTIQPFEKVDNTVADLEKLLGFKLNDYDPATGTVNGEPANIPGASAPIVGRINFATPEGRRFGQKVQKIVNTVLKERSGAAVTDSEMMRILEEFGTSKGKAYTEQDVMTALKALADVLQEDQRDVLRGFRPDIVDTYYNPSGIAKTYKREGGAKETGGGGLSAEKKARLEELRAKKARGEI